MTLLCSHLRSMVYDSVADTVTTIREIPLRPDWEREHLRMQEEAGIPLDEHRFDGARWETLASTGVYAPGKTFPSLITGFDLNRRLASRGHHDFAHANMGANLSIGDYPAKWMPGHWRV